MTLTNLSSTVAAPAFSHPAACPSPSSSEDRAREQVQLEAAPFQPLMASQLQVLGSPFLASENSQGWVHQLPSSCTCAHMRTHTQQPCMSGEHLPIAQIENRGVSGCYGDGGTQLGVELEKEETSGHLGFALLFLTGFKRPFLQRWPQDRVGMLCEA